MAAKEAQSAWKKPPADNLIIGDLCALQYARKVRKNNSVQIAGQVIDIPRSVLRSRGTFAGKTVIIRHLLNGRFNVYVDDELITFFEGKRPKRPAPGVSRSKRKRCSKTGSRCRLSPQRRSQRGQKPRGNEVG